MQRLADRYILPVAAFKRDIGDRARTIARQRRQQFEVDDERGRVTS